MREFLFKGKCIENKEWNIKEGEWVEGLPSYTSNKTERGKIDRILALKDGCYQYFLVDPETICQYIGYSDSKKNEAFEHDIIFHEGRNCYGHIIFKKGQFLIDWGAMADLRNDIDFWFTQRKVCIVGNIFDDSELLNAKYRNRRKDGQEKSECIL